MKQLRKKLHICVVLLLLSILGLIVVNTFGVFHIFVISESYTPLEFAFAFFYTFIFQLIGVAFIGYEGTGTPTNMLINGLFYFFIIIFIISVVLLVKEAIRSNAE